MTNLQIKHSNNGYAPLARTSVPDFRGTNNSAEQRDIVEIRGKENKKNKNLGIKLLLGALGVGAAIFAFVKLHKSSATKPKEELSAELKEIQQIYKDIFKRDISAEETKDFVRRYKKIIDSKTPDNDREYCENLLDEICKDRQTKTPKITRWYKSINEAPPRCERGLMATMPDGRTISVYIYNYYNDPKIPIPEKGMFETLFHETHHVKQDEIIYRTDKEFCIQHSLDKFIDNGEGAMYKNMLNANNGDKEKTLRELKETMKRELDFHWGSFAPFEKNSAEYQEGLRLIEGKKNYKPFWECASDEEYENQIIEKGAFADGRKAERLFDLLKRISL